MSVPLPLAPEALIRWAITEIRGLDELCRGQIPGYGPLDSEDMARIKELERLSASLGGAKPAK